MSTEQEIDCIVTVSEEDTAANKNALDCYVTFQETINAAMTEARPLEYPFEIFMEDHEPPLTDLFDKI